MGLGEEIFPALAVVDATLMATVPAKFKAYQRLDALFHPTEGFISNKRNEMSKMVASEAIWNVSQNLVETIRNPQNIEAMEKVAFGSYRPSDADKPEDFLEMLLALQEECGVADLKMSDFGIDPSTFEDVVRVAKSSMPVQFTHDPIMLSEEDCLQIFRDSYR